MSAAQTELGFSDRLDYDPFEKLRIQIHTPKQLPRTIPEHIVRELLREGYRVYSPDILWVLRDIVGLELLFGTGDKERVLKLASPELLHLMKRYHTSLLDAEVDIRYIQSLLGLSSISTPRIYTSIRKSSQK